MSRSLYNHPNLDTLLSTVENQNFERKSALIQPRDLAIELSAFANNSVEGGLVAVGISKDKKVEGINQVGQEKFNRLIQAQRTFCSLMNIVYREYRVTNDKRKEDKLLLFFVEFSADKVIRLGPDEAYERIGDQTCKMSSAKIKEMEYNKREADFEKELIPSLSIEQLSKPLMEDFIQKWAERDGLTGTPSFKDLILTKGYGKKVQGEIKINYAGALLFHNKPTDFIPGAKIRFLRYEGTKVETGGRSNIIKDKSFQGPLIEQIEQLSTMIKAQVKEFSFLGKDGKFKTILEYPDFAWLEGVVNAVAHRSYGLKNANIFVRMFDDHLEISSPGNLPSIVTVDNIYKQSFPRNPTLMQALLYLRYVKSASEGVDRIKKEMIDFGLPEPEFRDDKGAVIFTLILRNNIEKRTIKKSLENLEQLNKQILESLDEEEKRIVYYLLENKIGAPIDFEAEIKKGRSTVVRRLRHLEQLRIVARTKQIGPKVKYELTDLILAKPSSQEDLVGDKENGSDRQPKLL